MNEQIKNKNNLKIKVLLCITIFLILFVGGYILYINMASKLSNDTNLQKGNNVIYQNNNELLKETDTQIDIIIDDVIINTEDYVNNHLIVTGTINVSYDEIKYDGVSVFGYCLGSENEKYFISGPQDGRTFFHNDGDNSLYLTEETSSVVILADGSTKSFSEINWQNVKINSCIINKYNLVTKDWSDTISFDINFVKEFNN